MEVTGFLWDKHYVGQKLTSFSKNGELGAISKVTLIIDDDNSVSAGDNSGLEIKAECPFATQDMAEAILNNLKGYRYLAYSAESANLDPAAELGDGVTASGVYSIISQIDDNGNGYPSFSAPGESELQDEYPIVGPATQELQRRINAVKQWAEEHNKALKEEIEQDMEQAGKLITGQLGGHYVVTMNPETGMPNGWALMDTDSMETATKGWRATLGGIGFFSDGFNGVPNIALTMDGKINASMILTGELWANLIKVGRIQGRVANGPYFDLDANNGQGELAASVLKGVGDGSTTTARIGFGAYAGGGTYEGMRINTASGAGGEVTIAMQREQGDYTLSNDVDFASSGNLTIRSQAIQSNPGGNNSVRMTGNSTTGEGTISLQRGKRDGASNVFFSDKDRTFIQFTSPGGKNTWVELTGNRIGFGTDGVERGSLDATGWHGQGTTNG